MSELQKIIDQNKARREEEHRLMAEVQEQGRKIADPSHYARLEAERRKKTEELAGLLSAPEVKAALREALAEPEDEDDDAGGD